MKKLLKKFLTFTSEASRAESPLADCERLARSLLQELTAFEQPLLMSRAVIGANRREQQHFHELQRHLHHEIDEATLATHRLHSDLSSARVHRQHMEECEVLRGQIATQPTRRHSHRRIAELEAQVEALERENEAAGRLMELRRKQFALLMHTVCELQSAVEEDPMRDLTNGEGTPGGALLAHGRSTVPTMDADGSAAAAAALVANSSSPMAVDL